MRKSELIAALEKIEGDPVIVVYDSDYQEYDEAAAAVIRKIPEGYREGYTSISDGYQRGPCECIEIVCKYRIDD